MAHISLHPWSTFQDIQHAANALRTWLSEIEREPIDTHKLAIAWDSFRGCFGKPGTAPPGISIDGNSLPDGDGIRELIRRSTAISQQAQDDLLSLLDAYQSVLNALAEEKSSGRCDPKPIREFRKQLRTVINLLSQRETVFSANNEMPTVERGLIRFDLPTVFCCAVELAEAGANLSKADWADLPVDIEGPQSPFFVRWMERDRRLERIEAEAIRLKRALGATGSLVYPNSESSQIANWDSYGHSFNNTSHDRIVRLAIMKLATAAIDLSGFATWREWQWHMQATGLQLLTWGIAQLYAGMSRNERMLIEDCLERTHKAVAWPAMPATLPASYDGPDEIPVEHQYRIISNYVSCPKNHLEVVQKAAFAKVEANNDNLLRHASVQHFIKLAERVEKALQELDKGAFGTNSEWSELYNTATWGLRFLQRANDVRPNQAWSPEVDKCRASLAISASTLLRSIASTDNNADQEGVRMAYSGFQNALNQLRKEAIQPIQASITTTLQESARQTEGNHAMFSISTADGIAMIQNLGEIGPKIVEWLAATYNANVRYVTYDEVKAYLTKENAPNDLPRLHGVMTKLQIVEKYVHPPLPKLLEKLFESGSNPALVKGTTECESYLNWLHTKQEGWMLQPEVLLWASKVAVKNIQSEIPAPNDDLPEYKAEEQSWYSSLPAVLSVRSEELSAVASEIDIVLITATDPELKAVMRRLEPYPNQGVVLKGFVEQETYYIGKFGTCLAAVTRSEMGSLGSGSAILATQHAIRIWRPRAIVMVGIAFAKNPSKQKIADVLVASQVISYEPQRVGQAETIYRGPITPSSPTLLNRFNVAPDWAFTRPDGSLCQCHVGPVLSGEKLIDSAKFKTSLIDEYPQAIGGEMEGVGLAAAAVRENVPWILVKGICDWADGNKHGKHQPLAAASAVSLVHHVLSQVDVLHGLRKFIPLV